MKRSGFVALGCVLLALLACKGKGSSEKATEGSEATEGAEESAVAAGSFATATLSDFESRAKKARWNVLTTSSDTLSGVEFLDLELDDKKHYAYVAVVALSTKDAKPVSHAAKMGSDTGVSIHLGDVEPDMKVTATGILEKILAKTPVDSLTRDTLKAALKDQKFAVDSTDSSSEDGVTHTTISASTDDVTLEADLFDFKQAKKDGRIAVDGDRFMNVFVCKDCTKRKEGTFAEAWQATKARVLLGKLTNP